MRISISQIKEMKAKGEQIPMLTAYDYSTAKILDEAGIPLLLVGDSLGMVMLGYESTIPVTMDEMVHHAKAVVRGTRNALVVGDMPFMTYHLSLQDALRNAARFIQEAGCQAVKLEGGIAVAETVERIVQCGIPVMGHIGLTPQSINQLGGYKVQGKSAEAAKRLMEDAHSLERAGVFAVVMELVPAPLTKKITESLGIPVIGIGSGADCDGQVQVISDILGSFTDFIPKHAKRYANLAETIKGVAISYASEVKSRSFPTDKQAYTMDESLLSDL